LNKSEQKKCDTTVINSTTTAQIFGSNTESDKNSLDSVLKRAISVPTS